MLSPALGVITQESANSPMFNTNISDLALGQRRLSFSHEVPDPLSPRNLLIGENCKRGEVTANERRKVISTKLSNRVGGKLLPLSSALAFGAVLGLKYSLF